MSHRSLGALFSPGLFVLAGCPVEQTYADFIAEHGGTYASEGAGPGASEGAGDEGHTPTTSDGGSGAGDASGVASSATSTGIDRNPTTGEPEVDRPPVLDSFTVSPNPVLAAGFVELTAECSDDWGIAEVQFFVDGELHAAMTEAPFTATWIVKSHDQAGLHTLAVQCEDNAGHIVAAGQTVEVALPASGSIAWSQVHPAVKNDAEALDAAAAPDGSWWVCGYADNPVGGRSVWVAHYSPAGKELFNDVVFFGKDQTGMCSGIAVASADGHRAVLTGGHGPTDLWPSLWTALVDETEQPPVIAESNDALTGYFGNDVLVNQYGQFEVAGQRFVGGDDWDMVHQVYDYTPGDDELTGFVGLTHGDVDAVDIASAIVENPDGTVTLVGTLTKDWVPRAAAVKLDPQHQIEYSGGWPFWADSDALEEGTGAVDGALDPNGDLWLTGWRRATAKDESRIFTLRLDPQGDLVDGIHTEEDADFPGDDAGYGVAALSDGTRVVVGAVTTGIDDQDMWLRRYPSGKPMVLFQGLYGLMDEPRAVRGNRFDQVLVVGFETTVALQDGKPTAARRAWLRAYHP